MNDINLDTSLDSEKGGILLLFHMATLMFMD